MGDAALAISRWHNERCQCHLICPKCNYASHQEVRAIARVPRVLPRTSELGNFSRKLI